MQSDRTAAVKAALAVVSAFTEPVTQPMFGIRIYAPESSDTSEPASLTRQLMRLASQVQQQAEMVISGQSSSGGERFDESAYSQLEAALPMNLDLAKYLAAIRHLALALDENA
jgi:hypothetical protein